MNLPGTQDASAAIVFRNVSVRIGPVTILEEVTATAPRGGCSAVVGPNGAGKTTLLQALLGQIPFQGEIRLEGLPTGHLPRIGYVPQRPSSTAASADGARLPS